LKIAYCCEPQIGGTFSFFKRLRPALAGQGIDFRCIPPISGERFAGTRFAGLDGVDFVQFPETNLPEASRILIDHLIREQYDAVLVLPGCDVVLVNLVRYLPRTIRAAARVPMITRGTYAPTRSVAAHLNRVYAVSKRVGDDLEHSYGLPRDQIEVIYNGADIRPVETRRTFGENKESFKLLYAGRLTDLDKGVLLLPDILKRVRDHGLHAQLTVVGSGPDRDKLAERFDQFDLMDHVQLLGNIPLEEVDRHLMETDVFVLPSRFEGCPNALLEAMAAGCPSVAANIKGSVDQIIEHGTSGMLADVADPGSFARAIIELAADPDRCRKMSEAARMRIASHFTSNQMAEAYARSFRDMLNGPDRRPMPLSLDHYDIPREMKPTWRTRIPAPLKNFARKWMERWALFLW